MKRLFTAILSIFYIIQVNGQGIVKAQEQQKDFSGNSLSGLFDNSVNLLNGHLNFTETLASIEGTNGLQYSFGISYNSAGVKEQVGVYNMEAPQTELGLGWSLSDSRIVADHKGTGSRLDDDFYLIQNGSSSPLVRTSSWSNSGTSFKVLGNDNIEVSYQSGYFRIKDNQGNSHQYGGTTNSRGSLIKWGNWIGDSNESTGQSLQTNTWMISKSENQFEESILYSYIKDEEKVGTGTLNYTKWIYLKSVIGPKGDELIFHYNDKGDFEYTDPHQEAVEPDAYQEIYNNKYLSYLEKYDKYGNFKGEVNLEYSIFDSNTLYEKRILSGINVIDKNGYQSDIRNYAYHLSGNYKGLLYQVLNENGSKVIYNYENFQPNTEDIVAEETFTEDGDDETHYIDGPNFSLKLFQSSSNAVRAEIITFDGRWVKQNLSTIGYSNGNLKEFTKVEIGKNHIGILLRKSSSSSEEMKLTLLKPDVTQKGKWNKTFKYPNVGSGKPKLMVGDDYVAVGTFSKKLIYSYYNIKNSNDWFQNNIDLPSGSFSFDGTNNYIISHNEDGETINEVEYGDVIRFHILDQGSWSTTILPEDITFSSDDPSYWYASNSFAVVMADNNSEFIYMWDENYNNFSRLDLHYSNFEFDDLSSVEIFNNTLISIQERPMNNPKRISDNIVYTRFNGNNFNATGLSGYDTSQETNYDNLLGNDVGTHIQSDASDRGATLKYFYDTNNDSWETESLSNEMIPRSIGGNYVVFENDNTYYLHYRDPLFGTFEEKYNLNTIVGWSVNNVIKSPGRNRFSFKGSSNSVSLPVVRTLFFYNNFNEYEEVLYSGIDGSGSIYTRDKDQLFLVLSRKRKILSSLHDYQSTGAPECLKISSVELKDLSNTITEKEFEYLEENLRLGSDLNTLNYKNVIINGTGDSEKPLGFTSIEFDVDNKRTYGQAILNETFTANGSESISSSNSTISFQNKDVLGNSEEVVARQTLPNISTKTNSKDGFSTSSTTEFNDRGLPNTVSTTYYDAKGDYHEKKVETAYAYEEYPEMVDELLFSQVAMKSVYVDDELVERSVTTWADWGGDKWAAHKNFVWTGKSSGTFNDWGTSNPNGQYWKLTNEITTRDANLNVVESKDHKGIYSATIYNVDDLPIATFSDAPRNKVFADDFSDNSNGWTINTPIRTLAIHEGILDMSFPGTFIKELPSTITLNNGSYYIDFQFLNHVSGDDVNFIFGGANYTSDAGYRIKLNNSTNKVELYNQGNKIEEAELSEDAYGNWWQSVRIAINSSNNTVEVYLNTKHILTGSISTLNSNKVGFFAEGGNGYFIDNFRVYPSNAYASSYSYDLEDYYLVSELTEDNHIISHQVNDYGIEVSTTLETKQEIAGTSYASPANDLLPFGASLSTAVMGKTFFKDEFQLDLSGEWTELDASNGVMTSWNVEDGQLIVENSGSPSSWGVDALVYELEEDITSGIVGVEFDYIIDGDASGWNFGVAMGNNGYTPTSASDAIMFSAFSNSDKWRVHDGSPWSDITDELEKNRTYRVKIVANLDTEQIYFYLDGHILKKESFKESGHDLRKISLFNYGRNPFRGIVDNFIVYADPVHSIQYSDAFGRPLQSQSDAADGKVYVSETLYDEYGRELLTTKTTKVNADLGYNEGFVTGYNESNGELSGQISINNNGDLYAYHASIRENSPLNRTIETGLSGEEFNVNSNSSQTNLIEYNPSSIGIIQGNGMSRNYYYGQKTTNADGGEQMSLKNAIGQTILTRTGQVPVTHNYKLSATDGSTSGNLEINEEIYLTTSYEYDNKGNVVKVLPPAYYALPHADAEKEDYVSQYEYDHWGNVIREETPDKGEIIYDYDKDGKLQFRQDAKEQSNGKIRYWKYDAYDRITEIGFTDGEWSDIEFANQNEGAHRDYTPLNSPPYRMRPMPEGEPIDLTEPIPAFVANAETIIADHIVEPTDVVESVTYTASGSIVLKPGFHAQAGSEFTAKARNVNASGEWKKRFHYTEEGEFTNSRDQIAKVEYNEDTNPDAEVTESFDYDKDGQVIAHHTEAAAWGADPHTVEYEYNEKGEMIAKHLDASTTITYAYDKLGNLEKIGKPGDDDIYAQYEFDHNGALKRELLSNGNIISSYQYNSPGWVTDIHHHVGGASPTHTFNQQLEYTDDGAGYYTGLIKRSHFIYSGAGSPSNYSYTYSYDKAMQLTSATNTFSASGNIESITYDANRNIRTLDRGNAAELNYAYNPGTNQLNNVHGTANEYSYDAIGNVTKSPDIDEYQHDEYFNKTTQLTRTNGTEVGITSFAYNAGGERIVKKDNYEEQETKTVYIRGLSDYPVKEIYNNENGNSFVKYFVYGPSGIVATFGEDPEEGINYILKDHLGSARLVVNSTTSAPTVQTWYDYKPFGGSLRPNNAHVSMKYQFTGQENDAETGLYNYRARFYDTETGRFLGTDPQNQFHSAYVGIGNNPVNFVDPDGEFAKITFKLLVFMGETISGNKNPREAWGYANTLSDEIASVGQFEVYRGENFAFNAGYDPFSFGVSATATYSNNGFTASGSAGVGFFGKYYGGGLGYAKDDFSIHGGYYKGGNGGNLSGSVSYKGAGYYYTRTGMGTDRAQSIGGFQYAKGDFKFRLENDLFALHGDEPGEGTEDRWNTGGFEFQYKEYVLGSNIVTNDPKNNGSDYDKWGTRLLFDRINRPDKNGNQIWGSWEEGYVESSPIYLGYRNGMMTTRIGINHRMVQDIFQNTIHRWIGRQHYYNIYHFNNGFYFHSGYQNPYSIY